MTSMIYRLNLPLSFPEGLHSGEGKTGNHLVIARDGMGSPVLRGSALAGALRSGWLKAQFPETTRDDERDFAAAEWFGRALEGDKEHAPSPLRVPDCRLASADSPVIKRTHNLIDRHRGAALDNGLFSMDALGPGVSVHVVLWLERPKKSAEESKLFLQQIVALFDSGLTVGGHSARGIGRAILSAPATSMTYDLSDMNQHANWLDDVYRWRKGEELSGGEPIHTVAENRSETLRIELQLGVPGSEDILIGDGQGLDYEMEPQRVRGLDGIEYWRIPGSSLRGILRGWITRLASRDTEYKGKINDSLENWQNKEGKTTGKDLAWGHGLKADEIKSALTKDPDQLEVHVPCPIMQLFGSGYAKGRLHISDALSVDPAEPKRSEQVRAHVAVDRITGGANEGFFFQNTVLTGGPVFKTTITLHNPSEKEAKWLFCALRALDVGILRVGSSKAGGRLGLISPPQAKGMHAEVFATPTTSED